MSVAPAGEDGRERLIVALDHPTLSAALAQVDRLADRVWRYKVGLELYLAEGARAVDELVARNKRVFLDLKLHDIPETVERAARVVAAQSIDLLTVHAAGGRAMMASAVHGVRSAARTNAVPPRVLAVTVLTSLDQSNLCEDGNSLSLVDLVVARARLAEAAGCDGVIASPNEVSAIRAAVAAHFLVITPGVRPGIAKPDDQKRVATASAARKAGADAVVVGRPIRDASDPCRVVDDLIRELSA